MQKKHSLLRTLLATLLLEVTLPLACHADTAFLAGEKMYEFSSSAPVYPLSNSLVIGKRQARSIPTNIQSEASFYGVTVNPYTGQTLFMGQTEEGKAILSYGSIVSSSLTSVPIPQNLSNSVLVSAAFQSTETAIIGGAQVYPYRPTACRWSSSTNELSSIELPGVLNGYIEKVAVFPDNTILLLGGDIAYSPPIVYLLPPGATTATPVTLPDVPAAGILYCVAISAKGVATIGGFDGVNNKALVYRMTSDPSSAVLITGFDTMDGGTINGIGVTSNGTAVLAGETYTSSLLYRLLPDSTTVTPIPLAETTNIRFTTVSMGTDNIAIIGGYNSSTQTAIISRLFPDKNSLNAVEIPGDNQFYILGSAIGTENKAVLVGLSNDQIPIICTVATKKGSASQIEASSNYTMGIFYNTAVYSQDGLYDIRRIRPYYYEDIQEAKNILQKSGLK